MRVLQQRATQIVLSDPAVASVGSSVGASKFDASVNNGRHVHQPQAAVGARQLSSQQVINRLRPKLLDVGGMRVFMFPAQDMRAGGRQSSSSYQFTLWDPDLDELLKLVPRVVAKVQSACRSWSTSPPTASRTDCRPSRDRPAGRVRLGVRIQDIDNALNNAFSQRQISTIYAERNQYRVILEVDPLFQRDPSDLSQVYVAGSGSNAGAVVERGAHREDAWRRSSSTTRASSRR